MIGLYPNQKPITTWPALNLLFSFQRSIRQTVCATRRRAAIKTQSKCNSNIKYTCSFKISFQWFCMGLDTSPYSISHAMISSADRLSFLSNCAPKEGSISLRWSSKSGHIAKPLFSEAAVSRTPWD